MAEAIRILTPVGRLVQGHPLVLETVEDERTKQPKIGKDGQPQKQVYIALAFAKSDPTFMNEVWPKLSQVAERDWPSGEFRAPTFAWKVVDGDGVDRKGKPYASREGFAGHYILKIASGYLYQVVDQNVQPITDPKAIKRGDYLRAQVAVRGNAPSQTPGLYINPDFVQLCGYGKEIVSGPDVSAALAAAPAFALPPGASTIPTAPMAALPTVPGVPSVPGGNVPVSAPATATPVAPGAPGLPGAGYAPNPAFLMPPGAPR